MKYIYILFLFILTTFIAAAGLPSLIWSVTDLHKYDSYEYYANDLYNLNNGNNLLKDGIFRQNVILVKSFHTDRDGNVIITDYAYQDGRNFIEVTDNPLTIPLIHAGIGKRRSIQ